jgi:hypothetical protein
VIHLYSLSSSLPYVNHHLLSIFQSSSSTHRARYLIQSTNSHSILRESIQYPVCDVDVVRAIERIAGNDRKLDLEELPKRLFKGLTKSIAVRPEFDDSVDLPLFTHLLSSYNVSPNARKGYALARAVYARHLPLVRLLLAFGASPDRSEGAFNSSL